MADSITAPLDGLRALLRYFAHGFAAMALLLQSFVDDRVTKLAGSTGKSSCVPGQGPITGFRSNRRGTRGKGPRAGPRVPGWGGCKLPAIKRASLGLLATTLFAPAATGQRECRGGVSPRGVTVL